MGLVASLGACLSSSPPVLDDGGSTSGNDATTTSTTFEPTDGSDSGVSTCDQTPLRVATFNIQEVGFTSEDQFIGLAAILYRIDADVVCLQEVGDLDLGALGELADQAGYDWVEVADQSPAIGGEIRNACLAQIPMSLVGSYTASDLSVDATANDVGRDILIVQVEPVQGCTAGIITVHLKSGSEIQDTFRRAMEVERLVKAIETYRAQRPADAVVVGGDFNTEPEDEDLGMVFEGPVSGLPGSYDVGQDIVFPVTFEPFLRLGGLGFQIADATWEDSTNLTATWSERSRLDYIFYGQAILVDDEVYNSCEDNGQDDAPPGNWIPKRGEPLACYSSMVASDHLPVVADLVLP